MSTTPTPPNPFAVPMDQLATAAGVAAPAQPVPAQAPASPATPAQPEPTPAPAAPVAAQPAPVVPEKYSFATAENGEVTITLAPEYGGEVYKGKDVNEALAKLAGSKADANAYIKTLKNQPPAQPAQPEKKPEPVDPQVQATRDWLIAEQAAALGMTPEEYKARVSMVFQTTEQMATNIAIADFHKMCPGYVDTPQNSEIIGSYFPENFGRFPTALELKQAYALAVVDGKITPQAAQAAQAAPAAPRPPLMPSAGNTSQATGSGDPWTMPLDQLAQAAGLK